MINLPKNIEYIITDFDGVITDGFIYVSEDTTNQTKKISFKDVMGISLAVKNGYKVGIISGEDSAIIDFVTKKFNLEEVHKGIKDKAAVIQQIAEKYNIKTENIVYIGDDINDISALNLVGYPITVNNGNYKVKAVPNIQITECNGGDGAFREVIDGLLY